MKEEAKKGFCLSQFMSGYKHRMVQRFFVNLFNKLLKFDMANEVFRQQSEAATPQDFLDGVLAHLNIRGQYDLQEYQNIPETGPAVVIANHPSGLSETMLLTKILLTIRKDIKVLTTILLDDSPVTFDTVLISIDNISGKNTNRKSVEEAFQWVRSGGLLLVFPAGEISNWRFQPKLTGVYDSEWSRLPVSIAEKTDTPIIPVYISARNSWFFYFLRMLNRSLGLSLIFRELFRQRGKSIKFRVGFPVQGRDLTHLRSSREKIEYLYHMTYSLRHRPAYQSSKKKVKTKRQSFMIETMPHYAKIQAEVDQIILSGKMIQEVKSFQVFLINPEDDFKQLRKAIYIERERAFRAIGMGSQQMLDTDKFDEFNYQLCVWDKVNKQVVGGYRFSIVDFNQKEQRRQLSLSTLYHVLPINTDYQYKFMEMGRSFVQTDYQNQYWPLLILWRGLSSAILKFKDVGYVVGLVSVPSDLYGSDELDMLSAYVKSQQIKHQEHAQHFVPHFPYKKSRRLPKEVKHAIGISPSLSSCEFMLKQLQLSTASFPLLLRHYEAVGAVPLHMSKDPFFGNCVDVMMFWDIEKTSFSKLRPYAGKKGVDELVQRFAKKKKESSS